MFHAGGLALSVSLGIMLATGGCALPNPPDSEDRAAGQTAPVVGVWAGRAHACARPAGAGLWCWGDNRSSQISDLMASIVSLATPVVVDAPVVDLSGDLTCWANAAGVVRCAGEPKREASLTLTTPGVSQIAAGHSHVCALTGGLVRCVGNDEHGQLGPEEPISADFVAAAGSRTCALQNGEVVCWGLAWDRVGVSADPVTLEAPIEFRDIALSERHGCGISTDLAVWCWGDDRFGAVAFDGVFAGQPTQVWDIADVAAISVADDRSCAVLLDGEVACWGGNSDGQLGDGTTTSRRSPVISVALEDAIDVALGAHFGCARRRSGVIRCFGQNESDQLGRSTQNYSPIPQMTLGISSTMVAVGPAHVCAATEDGTVRCIGQNESGQLGDGSRTSNAAAVPGPVLPGIVGLEAGEGTTCALLEDSVTCWGGSELRFGDIRDLPDTYDARAVAVGRDFIVVVNARNQARTFLVNPADPFVPALPELVQLPEGDEPPLVAVGDDFVCASAGDGQVYCWGEGGPIEEPTQEPQAVAEATGANALGAGPGSVCAALPAEVRCWGDRFDGVQAFQLAGASSVSVGRAHHCAATSSGASVCWGDTSLGQSGIGELPSGARVAGGDTTCVGGDVVTCWGASGYARESIRQAPSPVLGLP